MYQLKLGGEVFKCPIALATVFGDALFDEIEFTLPDDIMSIVNRQTDPGRASSRDTMFHHQRRETDRLEYSFGPLVDSNSPWWRRDFGGGVVIAE